MRKEANYLYLVIGLLTAVVLVTSASPLSLLSILGVFTAALSLLVTAYVVTGRRRQLMLAVLFGASAFLPFAWLSVHQEAFALRTVKGVFSVNLVFWLLFTFYIGVLVFRNIMNARRVHSNEIYGAIYVYLLIGVLFAQVYHLLLAWQPGALYFDPGRFPGPQVTRSELYIRPAGDVLYYSFVTLGTVGYGDVTPSSPLARSLGLIEAVIGIMYVATMIARFVSIQTSGDSRGSEPEYAELSPSRGHHPGVTRAAEEKVEGNNDPAVSG
jgi:hypothetical protein